MSSPISRRQFFRLRPSVAARLAAEDSPTVGEERSLVRPPGAIRPETAFRAACDHCGLCVPACPFSAIQLLGADAGVDEGTPVLYPEEVPCRWCPHFECINACPTPALTMPEEGKPKPIASVALTLEHCLNTQGTLCDECATVCPPGVRAIRMVGHAPRLDTRLCTGCGLCAFHCPSTPAALVLVHEPPPGVDADASSGA